MQIVTKRNLVLTTASSLNFLGRTYQVVGHGELYQHIVSALLKGSHKIQGQEFGELLIGVAEYALGVRQSGLVEQVSHLLINAPLPRQYHSIGRYYEGLSRSRQGDYTSSTAMLEQLSTNPNLPLPYRARALKAIGGNHLDLGDIHESLRYFVEAFRTSSTKGGHDLLTATLSSWMIAVIRSVDGDHKGACKTLDDLFPFIQLIAMNYPHYYYAYYNARAVELGELNRFEEARAALRIAIASPFSHQHTEIMETANDISRRLPALSRSTISVSCAQPDSDLTYTEGVDSNKASATVVPIGRDFFESGDRLSLHDDVDGGAQKENRSGKFADSTRSLKFKEPVSLLPFPNRHNSSSGTQQAVHPINILHFYRMSVGQKRSLVMEVVKEHSISGDTLEKMLIVAGVIGVDDDDKPVYQPNTINLEQRGILEEIISLWVDGEISPDDFAAVFSALRDCDDNFRLINILDRMISLSFRSTPDRARSEDKWRRAVETKLKTELENEELLREKISLWVQGEITPKDFAAVLYALRNCQDDKRRNRMLDRMIGYAYLQIERPLENEIAWRKRVESRLAEQEKPD